MGKRLFSCIIFLFLSIPVIAGEPLVGVLGIDQNSPRTVSIAYALTTHLENIMNTAGVFEVMKSAPLMEQMKEFNCSDETCQIRFARRAEMDMFIRGRVEDRGDELVIILQGHGIGLPYHGSVIYRYRVVLETGRNLEAQQYSYLAEEHAGRFLTGLMKRYRRPVPLAAEGDRYRIEWGRSYSGDIRVYARRESREQSLQDIRYLGKLQVRSNHVDLQKAELEVDERPFIYQRFTSRAEWLARLLRGRKEEIVFGKPKYLESLYTLLLSPVASATMPISAPILYYRASDWEGLGLWMVNTPFYIYLEIAGWSRFAPTYRKKHRDLSREIKAGTAFTWYLFFAGGVSHVVDALAHTGLEKASRFTGDNFFLGNDVTAGYLALVAGGAGHFYRGSRLWGYIYYHANNILLFLTMRELYRTERWDSGQGKYIKEKRDRTLGFVLLGAYGLLKIGEVIHAVLMPDRISSGRVTEQEFRVEPWLSGDENLDMRYGVRFSYRF
jgi:hypothetical protein